MEAIGQSTGGVRGPVQRARLAQREEPAIRRTPCPSRLRTAPGKRRGRRRLHGPAGPAFVCRMSDAHRDDAVPGGWDSIEGLVCGFGSRTREAPPATRLLRRQVHGNRVVDAAVGDAGLGRDATDPYPRVEVEADALVCARAGIVAGVRTADCVPILLVAPLRRWAAVVHAGWRGTIADIAGEAVRAAEKAGVRPSGILAALGPSIGSCCYEVSDDLGDDFERAGLPVLRRVGRKPHLDLRDANHVLLERAGVPRANIQNVGPCTRCANDLYHSFRAQPEAAGRQISWIGWS